VLTTSAGIHCQRAFCECQSKFGENFICSKKYEKVRKRNISSAN
jgi:hypothetical protein